MTLDELLKNWADESNAANDCIIMILESYMEFCDLCIRWQPPTSRLAALAKQHVKDWKPVLEFAQNHKEKEQSN